MEKAKLKNENKNQLQKRMRDLFKVQCILMRLWRKIIATKARHIGITAFTAITP